MNNPINPQDSEPTSSEYNGLSSPPPLEGQVDAYRTIGKLANIGNGVNLLNRGDSNFDTARNFGAPVATGGEGDGGGPRGTPLEVTICKNGLPVTVTILTV